MIIQYFTTIEITQWKTGVEKKGAVFVVYYDDGQCPFV
jgi:hypothetical protein